MGSGRRPGVWFDVCLPLLYCSGGKFGGLDLVGGWGVDDEAVSSRVLTGVRRGLGFAAGDESGRKRPT